MPRRIEPSALALYLANKQAGWRGGRYGGHNLRAVRADDHDTLRLHQPWWSGRSVGLSQSRPSTSCGGQHPQSSNRLCLSRPLALLRRGPGIIPTLAVAIRRHPFRSILPLTLHDSYVFGASHCYAPVCLPNTLASRHGTDLESVEKGTPWLNDPRHKAVHVASSQSWVSTRTHLLRFSPTKAQHGSDRKQASA